MNNINKENNEYAIYLRKSRADIEEEMKGEAETLARHENILLELSNKKGLKIGKIYKEIVSGETIEARPEMKKLLEDVKSGKWKGVLVVEVERLARGETMDQGLVAKAFKISNTKIITPLKVYDPSNEFDEEYFEFGLFMSRREYKVINRRLQRGRLISVNEGKYIGSIAPFGYDRVKIKGEKGYTLEQNSESNIVKIIFNLYAYENLPLNKIAIKLNEMGFKPRKTKKWSTSSIKDILSNPVYIGKIRWNARKEIKIYKNDKIIKIRPRNKDYILVNGLHKPIIDIETWKIAEEKRKLNIPTVKNNNIIQNPLCGIVICAKCGKIMKRRPYKNKEPVLYCDNPECNNISTKLYLVEEKIIEGLKLWFERYNFENINYINKIQTNKMQTLENIIFTLKKEKKKENDKLLSIFGFLEDGTYTREMFKKRREIISDNIKKIDNSIQKYELKLEQEKGINIGKNLSLPKLNNIIDVYNLLDTAEEKNNLLKAVLVKVTYLKTKKSIKKNSDPTNFIINLYPKIEKSI